MITLCIKAPQAHNDRTAPSIPNSTARTSRERVIPSGSIVIVPERPAYSFIDKSLLSCSRATFFASGTFFPAARNCPPPGGDIIGVF